MTKGHHVYVMPTNTANREWVEEAATLEDAAKLRKFLQHKLPEGYIATNEHAEKRDVPTFDQTKLVDRPVWKDQP